MLVKDYKIYFLKTFSFCSLIQSIDFSDLYLKMAIGNFDLIIQDLGGLFDEFFLR